MLYVNKKVYYFDNQSVHEGVVTDIYSFEGTMYYIVNKDAHRTEELFETYQAAIESIPESL